jgi:curved DNA-binding protein CbpA
VATHYEVLGIAPDASKSAIRSAYRELAKRHHPDHQKGTAAHMVSLNLAYEVLADSQARAAYDRSLLGRLIDLPQRPTSRPGKQATPNDPSLFLLRIFRPLDATVRQAVRALRVAIDELAYDIYDDVFLAKFASALARAEDDIGAAERLLRSHVWPESMAAAFVLYGQGLRQIEDAMGDFQDFTENFNVDLLAWGIDIVAQGVAQLDEACQRLPT